MKICYRVLVTNSMLKNMGITESNLCNFCVQVRDTIMHYLWQCTNIQKFWEDFTNVFHDKCTNANRLKLTPCLILFGVDKNIKTDEGFDFILMHTKFFIHKCRIKKSIPQINMWIAEMKQIYLIDKYSNKLEMTMNKFERKWIPYLNIIQY